MKYGKSMKQYLLFNITAEVESVPNIDNTKLAEEVLAYQKRRSEDPTNTQFEDTILLTPYGSEAKKLISYMSKFGEDSYHLSMNGFWSQIHHPLESTDTHYHGGNATKSWVYYVKVPNNSGDLLFLLDDKDDRSPKPSFKPVEGEFIIFDSYLRHKVTKNMSNDIRISIAGDFKV